MTNKEKMHIGALYDPNDSEIMTEQGVWQDQVDEYNRISRTRMDLRTAMLKEMFAEIGENCYVESPLHSNMGCRNVHFGKNIYANYNLTLVDDTHIYVGDYTMFGPNVTIATAGHPIHPDLRRRGLQYNLPVHIGSNCWLGAGVIVMPGVTIGDNTVIGAGSVVTKDIPGGVVAVGNPCRVLREVGEHDKNYYWRDKRIDWDEFGE